ncbi:uncharacterized protein BKA55DRAFT_743909 [Fusarium redolens]|uniref:Uncharacterized protein n=1 Tax=Fusarium redolens TaxID=48865 RepID=A0A9P9G0S6_FUSRE|nr:uncharacterized protein BKA55DRAFT_743909 [Fusarium redolens]KAH7222688.1 hypothetical protein BKA55DRAFT_743909 [Fusarium redolens]
MITDLHKPDPMPQPQRLARRADVEELISGTITVTVAPDSTCGFNANRDRWTCDEGLRCVWESGKINRVWCESHAVATTCLDRTVYLDPAKCNNECSANSHIAVCASTAAPVCATLELGDGIFSYWCSTLDFIVRFDSTPLQPRELSTLVLVDGHEITGGLTTLGLEPSTTESGSTTITASETENSSSLTEPSTSATPSPGPNHNVGAIVGGVVGGLAVIVMGIFGLVLLRRRRGNKDTLFGSNSGSAPQPQFLSNMPDTAEVVGSPARAAHSPNTGSPIGPQFDAVPIQSSVSTPQPTPSKPPLYEAPSPETVWSCELDGGGQITIYKAIAGK